MEVLCCGSRRFHDQLKPLLEGLQLALFRRSFVSGFLKNQLVLQNRLGMGTLPR
jgi:hypothetical protein